MALQFRKAEKAKSKLRLALIGPSGSGKSYTALTLGQRLAAGGKMAVIDTERGSASLYADLFGFDVLELDEFDPRTYVEAIHAAEQAGYTVIVVDSLSHAWSGKGGALELVDKAAKRQQSGNSFGAWREVTPLHNQLVDAMLGSPAHIIATMRAKTEYVQEKDERTGKTTVRKVGLAPVQRDGLEYEFTLVGDMDIDNNLIVSKSRIPALAGQVIPKPDAKVAEQLLTWLDAGAEARPAKPAQQFTPAQKAADMEPPADDEPLPMTGAEFVATARDLGFPDAVTIAKAIGATAGNTPEEAIKLWRKQPGHSYEVAVKLLANARDKAAEQPALAGVGAARHDPDDDRRGGAR